MRQRHSWHCAPGLLGLLLIALPLAQARAIEGVIEINAAKVAAGGVTPSDTPGVPVTIDTTGSYRLTSNLSNNIGPIGVLISNPENLTVVEITADDVDLDLNGFAIQGFGVPGTGDGVRSTGKNTVVRNGNIEGQGQDGLDLGVGARVANCTVVGNSEDGVETGVNSRVVDCVVQGNGAYGLNLGDASAYGGMILTGNNGGDPNPQIASKSYRPPVELGSSVCNNGTNCAFAPFPAKLVFVTVVPGGGGNLGGVVGADLICQNAAAGAALPGVYLAWISDGIDSPAGRFFQSPGNYELVNGTTVALDWADLTDGSLLSPINRTEFNGVLLDPETWTNVTTGGAPAGGSAQLDHCVGWNDGGPIFGGRTGSNFASDATWTAVPGSILCNTDTVFLYCFEQ